MIVKRVPPDEVPPDGDREVMVVVGQCVMEFDSSSKMRVASAGVVLELFGRPRAKTLKS